jgi:hypothetical protein
LLLMRIKNHEMGTLCRQVYEEGKHMGWPGLGQEVSDICAELGIPDVNNMMVSKHEVKNAIFDHHYNDMVNIVNTKTKLDDIKGEDFREVQSYFNDKSVENTRMAFKVRTQMVPNIPGNFKNKYRVKGTEKEGLVCSHCQQGEILTQSHCLTCSAWAELRDGLDLTN